MSDSTDYNKNRAKIAWYNIEPTLQDKNSSNNPLSSNLKLLSDPRVRQVFTNELFLHAGSPWDEFLVTRTTADSNDLSSA